MVAEPSSEGGRVLLEATPALQSLIAGIGRTEDLRFSPDGRRLAIVGYLRNEITVLSLEVRSPAAGKVVAVDGGVVISSAALRRPHGLDFLDDDTLIVANRAGGVPLLRIPPCTADPKVSQVTPIRELSADGVANLNGPGSVSVLRAANSCEVYICNNFSNQVTRHQLDAATDYRPISGEVLLQKWMDIPDGIAVSADHEWLAVSQAACGIVCVYPNSLSLGTESDPSAILRQVHYPHGLQFSTCNRFLLVVDAGRPHLLVFKRPAVGWYGVLQPAMTVAVMDESQFLRGHSHPDEGGPKGLDLHRASGIVALTCEFQTLAFVDMSGILARLASADTHSASGFVSMVAQASANGPFDHRSDRDSAAAEVAYELHMLGNAKDAVAAGIADIKRTRSWRITAPLRKLSQLVNKV